MPFKGVFCFYFRIKCFHRIVYQKSYLNSKDKLNN